MGIESVHGRPRLHRARVVAPCVLRSRLRRPLIPLYAGFRNRKFFVLFVLYSAAFCAMGAAHSWYELLALAPARGYVDDDAARPPHISRARVAIAWLHALLARADGANCGLYARAVLLTCALNPAGALLLGGFGLNQLLLVLVHLTTHPPCACRL